MFLNIIRSKLVISFNIIFGQNDWYSSFKRESPYRLGTERDVTAWRDRGRGHGQRSGRGIHGAISVLEEDVVQSMAGRPE